MAAKQILYAAIGAGDLAVEKARKARALDVTKVTSELGAGLKELRGLAEKAGRAAFVETAAGYKRLAKRGRKRMTSTRTSPPAKRAAAQVKSARSQTKTAADSLRKAAAATVEATRDVASEAG